mgnify:CR=1 FL=1
MHTLFGIVFSLLFFACSTTVSRLPAKNAQNLSLPTNSDDENWNVSLENEQDLRIIFASAYLHSDKWSQKERTRTEAWVLQQMSAHLKQQDLRGTVSIWSLLANWYARTRVKPSRAFEQATQELMNRVSLAGNVSAILQILFFGERMAPDNNLLRGEDLIDGIIDLERVRIELCRFENKQNPERCVSQGNLEREAYRLLPVWVGADDIDMLKRMSLGLWGVPKQVAFSTVPEWIVQNAPHDAKLHEADHWFGLCLFDNGCFRQPSPSVLNAMAKLNAYVHEAWSNLVSPKPSVIMLESLARYIHERLGPAFALRLCETVGTELFLGNPRIALCRNRVLDGVEYSLLRRKLLNEQIRVTPHVRELWEELFQTTVQRFFHFAEREQLEHARREYAYLEQLVRLMETRWPSSEKRNSLVVQALAISELYLLRGQVEKARETVHGVFETTHDPRLLQSLFRMEFWSGNYAKAVEIMKKMEEMAQHSVQNRYLYMRQSRYHALALEHLGERNAASQLRLQAAGFFRGLFDFVTDPDLRTELVLYIAELYFDVGQQDTGLQLFQAVLSRSSSCDLLSQILKTLIVYERVDAAFDVYHTLMDSNSCFVNRKVYTSVWMRFFGLRHVITDERMETVNEFLSNYGGETWLSHLAAFARGTLTSKQLLSKASNVGQQVEALYYSGLDAWARGDAKTAFDLFRQVQRFRILNYTEHEFVFWHFEMQKRESNTSVSLPKLPPQPETLDSEGEVEEEKE